MFAISRIARRSPLRPFHRSLTSPIFEKAVARVKSLKQDPGNDAKLKLYALYKQTTVGPCNVAKPSILNFVEKAKYDAWLSLKDMPQSQAADEYIQLVNSLAGSSTDENKDASSPSHATPANPRSLSALAYPLRQQGLSHLNVTTITTENNNGIVNMSLNRPNIGNAFNLDMWLDYGSVFRAINAEEQAKVVVLTGAGKSFSTGMDLSVFADMNALLSKEPCQGRRAEAVSHIIQFLQDAVSSPARCKVPVIAAIHGNCIGGAVDIATACDIRYCTEDAVFCIKETDLAMVADIGTLQRLPKIIGDQATRELAYTGIYALLFL